MKHLPSQKQAELKTLTHLIKDNCKDTQMIILFGSYARGDYKEAKDLDPNRKTGHISDYDILVVTSKKAVALDHHIWDIINNKIKKYNFSAHPRIITHDIVELNNKLSQGQYFYTDIKKEGVVLFDNGKFELEEEKALEQEERKKIIKEHFEHWFKRSSDFWKTYNTTFKQENYSFAAFFLHQATESAYKTILLVFTNYNPNEHFLEILAKDANKHHPDLTKLFLQETKEQKDRFKLLEYAYIGGRYDSKYQIAKDDLEILAIEVKKLLEITQKICEDKIS